MKAIIIGSGASGLTAGAYLAQAGHQVVVYEQYKDIGGVTATYHQDGFGWDIGPLIIEGLDPFGPIGLTLSELGIRDQLTIIRSDRGLNFPDFSVSRPDEYLGPYWRREYFKEIFPNEAQGIDRYYEFYDEFMDLLVYARNMQESQGFGSWYWKLKFYSQLGKFLHMKNWNTEKLMNHFFKDKKLQAIFTVILADFIVRPTQCPGLVIPAINPETAFDKRIPLQTTEAGPRTSFNVISGGCGNLVKALASVITSHAGQIHTDSPVRKVVIKQNKVNGVELEDGHFESADVVIASGGAKETFFKLIGQQYLPKNFIKKIDNVPLMESIFMVHLGVKFDPSKYQKQSLVYYYGTYDIEEGIDHIQKGLYHEGRDGFLIFIPSKHSPQLAPKGHHAVTVYTIAPNRLRDGTWEEQREEQTNKLLVEAEKFIPGLRKNAVVTVSMTPDDFRHRTHLRHHSFGGSPPFLGKPAAPHQTPIKGMWFIGHQSESMGGVSNVVSGGRKTAKRILSA